MEQEIFMNMNAPESSTDGEISEFSDATELIESIIDNPHVKPEEIEKVLRLSDKMEKLRTWLFTKLGIGNLRLKFAAIPLLVTFCAPLVAQEEIGSTTNFPNETFPIKKENFFAQNSLAQAKSLNVDSHNIEKYGLKNAIEIKNTNTVKKNYYIFQAFIMNTDPSEYYKYTKDPEKLEKLNNIHDLCSELLPLMETKSKNSIGFEAVSRIKEIITEIKSIQDNNLGNYLSNDNYSLTIFHGDINELVANLIDEKNILDWDLETKLEQINKEKELLIKYIKSNRYKEILMNQGLEEKDADDLIQLRLDNLEKSGYNLNVYTDGSTAAGLSRIFTSTPQGKVVSEYELKIDPTSYHTLNSWHENTHISVNAGGLTSPVASALTENFNPLGLQSIAYDGNYNKWASNIVERYAVFTTLVFELDRLGIKKIDDPLTMESYGVLVKIVNDWKQGIKVDMDSNVIVFLLSTKDFGTEIGFDILKSMFDVVAYHNTDESEKPDYSDPSISNIPDYKTTT